MSSPTITRTWEYILYKPNTSDLAGARRGRITAEDLEEAQKTALIEVYKLYGVTFMDRKWDQMGITHIISQDHTKPKQKRHSLQINELTRIKESFTELVKMERDFQEEKWGPQNHNEYVFYGILGEECGEVAQAINTDDPIGTIKELVQVAAVAQAFAEMLLRAHNNE